MEFGRGRAPSSNDAGEGARGDPVGSWKFGERSWVAASASCSSSGSTGEVLRAVDGRSARSQGDHEVRSARRPSSRKPGGPEDRYRLRVIASDVTHRRMLVLPDDAAHLGVNPDELEIARAVRMSMSLPIFFEPVVHENGETGEDHLIVDGGMLSNFPVWLFDRKGQDPRWPTFGLSARRARPQGGDRPSPGRRGARRQAGLAGRPISRASRPR